MKSIVIQQPNALAIEERPLPQPGNGEVRVKVKLAEFAAQIATSIVDITRSPNIPGSSATSFSA